MSLCVFVSLFRWMTCIALPLKQEMQDDHHSLSLAARFRDIHPSLLLFLHRLRSIEVVNKVYNHKSILQAVAIAIILSILVRPVEFKRL